MMSDERLATDALREARAVKGAELARGKTCPVCEAPLHGLEQPFTVKHQPMTGLEVGCLVCKDVRAFGTTADAAHAAFDSKIDEFKARHAPKEA